jgi:hypothetical protein
MTFVVTFTNRPFEIVRFATWGDFAFWAQTRSIRSVHVDRNDPSDPFTTAEERNTIRKQALEAIR